MPIKYLLKYELSFLVRAYCPKYSCRSVLWWLLILVNQCPVLLDKYSTIDVFPADVGPLSEWYAYFNKEVGYHAVDT